MDGFVCPKLSPPMFAFAQAALNDAASVSLPRCSVIVSPRKAPREIGPVVNTSAFEPPSNVALARGALLVVTVCGLPDTPMFCQGNSELIAPNMTLFAHMIIVDSEAEAAMTLGRTYLTTETQPRPLSRHDLDLIVK